jgi:hypothetical protein
MELSSSRKRAVFSGDTTLIRPLSAVKRQVALITEADFACLCQMSLTVSVILSELELPVCLPSGSPKDKAARNPHCKR